MVPPFCGQPSTFSIYGPSIRPFCGPTSIHKIHGCSHRLHLLSSAHLPVSRRLAHSRDLRDASELSCGHHQRSLQATRPDDQYREVHSGSHRENRLHWGNPGLQSRQRLPTTASVSGNGNNYSRPPKLPDNLSSHLSQPPRPHGCLHLRDQTHQTTPPSTSNLAHLCILAGLRHPRLPGPVADSHPGLCRDAIPATSIFNDPNHGRVISGLGCPPRGSPHSRPLVCSRTNLTYQCAGAEGGSTHVPGVFGERLQGCCVCVHRQHNGHVLHKQAGRSTLLPPLSGSHSALGLLHSPLDWSGSILSPRSSEHPGGSPQQILPVS
ncbi:uncharacterized protein LOC127056297 [Gopherus flavomarginatus]|uniref:uncharacterized protein LOC127056297 n=1 Tax=Gopherus flavomarginatus TaxID=286002 RepID=UPI0021CBAB36|nr:uncharacterized protein LOC127056297 [Gopherus flavomarginatus]